MSNVDLCSFFFSYASRIVRFPGIQTPFVCNLALPHRGPSNRVTFRDCTSSLDENLIRSPHESSILLSSPNVAKAPISKEMTRDFNNFTRLSFEPPQNIEGWYISSLNNTLYFNSASQNYTFFQGPSRNFVSPLPNATTSSSLRSVRLTIWSFLELN